MSAAQHPQVQLLLTKSAEDEAVLGFAVPDAVFAFHAQQAVEKLLKALIAAHGEVFPHTHNIQLLLDQIAKLDDSWPHFAIPLHSYTPYGVVFRYDHAVPVTEQERREHRQVVSDLRRVVLERVSLLD